ncbi:MAG: hypothetical protein IKX58_02695 [Clostridia bacterium]|nr:hypothetical protein [Clostridia bacterium]
MALFDNKSGSVFKFSDTLKYVDDYKIEEVENSKGRKRKVARYIGPWVVITTEKKAALTRMIIAAVLGVIAAVCHIWTLMMGSHFGSDNYLIMGPRVFALFPVFYLLMGIIDLPYRMKPMHRDREAHSFIRISRSGVAVMIMTGLSLITGLIYRFIESFMIFIGIDWMYIALSVITIVCLFVMLRLIYNIDREEKPNSYYSE